MPGCEEYLRWPQGNSVEICEVADMVFLALYLTRAGIGDYWDDVDRWVRNVYAEGQMLDADFLELADYGNRAVQELVMGIRAFFRTSGTVTDHVHKVAFWEKEADTVAERLKRRIFEADVELSCKMHRSSFVWYIDEVADQAEDVSERLSISAIKRSI